MSFRQSLLLSFWIIINLCAHAQTEAPQTTDTAAILSPSQSSKYLDIVSNKAVKLEQKLDKQSAKALRQMQKLEGKIKKRLAAKDSLKSAAIFGNAEQQYKQLEQRLEKGISLQQYIPNLDTLKSSIKFLQQNTLLSSAVETKQKLKDAMSKVSGMEGKFQKAEEIKNFLKERKTYFKQQLQNIGFARELKKINKQAYYNSEQLNEYKDILKDHTKAERKALELLSKSKLFQNFFRKNSLLASLFRLPGDDLSPTGGVGGGSLSGLQTRASVNNLIQTQLPAGGPGSMAQFQQNMREAQSKMNELKNKLNQFGGGSSDDEMPDGFIANPAKSKNFIQRIKLNADFQTSRHNNFFPINSDIGLSLNYMLNSNSHFSLGTSFKMGWGSGLNHIRLSSQGVSIRGGLDWRLKGNLFIAGNYEQNYFSAIRNIDQLRDYSSWKTSALLGLSKKYNIPSPFGGNKAQRRLGTKFGKGASGGEIKLLYDFFYNRPPVRTQPLVFRIGYSLN